jgi:hypothetical protein
MVCCEHRFEGSKQQFPVSQACVRTHVRVGANGFKV